MFNTDSTTGEGKGGEFDAITNLIPGGCVCVGQGPGLGSVAFKHSGTYVYEDEQKTHSSII